MGSSLLAAPSKRARRQSSPATTKQEGGQTDPQAWVFPSELGWMAIVLRGEALVQLSFGHASPPEALKALDQPALDGPMLAVSSRLPALARRLQAYAKGERDGFRDVPLDLGRVTAFERQVVEACRRILYGSTLTYSQLAAQAGSPRAARAVGSVMRKNRCPLVVPCHRVIAAGGTGAYSAASGVRTKLRLLEMEGREK